VALAFAPGGESLAQLSSPGQHEHRDEDHREQRNGEREFDEPGGPAFRYRCRFRRMIAISSGLTDSSAKRIVP
jgi:hypothetical protein